MFHLLGPDALRDLPGEAAEREAGREGRERGRLRQGGLPQGRRGIRRQRGEQPETLVPPDDGDQDMCIQLKAGSNIFNSIRRRRLHVLLKECTGRGEGGGHHC